MEIHKPVHLWPTLTMVAECLNMTGWDCKTVVADREQRYREVRLYHSDQILKKDVLYLLRPEEKSFPTQEYAYISSGKISGSANHMICPAFPDEVILDRILEVFSQFRDWEEAMDQLLYRDASLQELCELGAQILENPVWIHDDWFVMMAMSREFSQIMEPEYLVSSAKGFVPRAVVDDFRNDSNYLETYAHRRAQIWYAPEYDHQSLYVNLWEGSVYKGRLLVAKKNRDFLERDFQLAEALTQRALMLLRRKTLGSGEVNQNMDDIVFDLLQGNSKDTLELEHLLSMLRWQKQDRFLCLRVRNQAKERNTMIHHMLHSDLFRCFPDSYILLDNQEQCVILNLNRQKTEPDQIRQQLEPLCRDYCLYAGISSPADSIQELNAAYLQAGIALDSASRKRSEKSILFFSQCALDYLMQSAAPLTPRHLVSPALADLKVYDQENRTPYFETLRQYLLLERDVPKTSEKLIVHRTTLLYRLKKIQSLMNLDLEDPWKRLYLMLSLWILEQEEQTELQ